MDPFFTHFFPSGHGSCKFPSSLDSWLTFSEDRGGKKTAFESWFCVTCRLDDLGAREVVWATYVDVLTYSCFLPSYPDLCYDREGLFSCSCSLENQKWKVEKVVCFSFQYYVWVGLHERAVSLSDGPKHHWTLVSVCVTRSYPILRVGDTRSQGK